MVDRYYLIENSGGSPEADLTFRYAPMEQAQAGNTLLSVQRWLNGPDVWELPLLPNQTFNGTKNNSIN